MVANILYILSLVLFFGLFLFYLYNKKKSMADPDLSQLFCRYDFLFYVLFYSLTMLNVGSAIYVVYQNQYMKAYFSWVSAPFLFALLLYFPLCRFLYKKYEFDKDGKKEIEYNGKIAKRKNVTIYTTLLVCLSLVAAFIPSYLIFGVFLLPMKIDAASEFFLLFALIALSAYQIFLSIYRMMQKGQKEVSNLSIFISVACLLLSVYCYCLLLDCYFLSAMKDTPYISAFSFVGMVLLISYYIVTSKVEKKIFKDKKQLSFKDGFLIIQITNIVEGICLPISSVLFYVLNNYGLIQ